jgi:hypothetical protein
VRLCCVIDGDRVMLLDHTDAPPTIEFIDRSQSRYGITRVLERLTSTADPVNGIVMYEELPR